MIVVNPRLPWGVPDGRAFFYKAGSTTELAAIFGDEGMTAPLSNPLRLPTDGRPPMVYASESVHVDVQEYLGVQPDGQEHFASVYQFDWDAPSSSSSLGIQTLQTRAGLATADKTMPAMVIGEGAPHVYTYIDNYPTDQINGVTVIGAEGLTGCWIWNTSVIELPQAGCLPGSGQTGVFSAFQLALSLGLDVKAVDYMGNSIYVLDHTGAYSLVCSGDFTVDAGVRFTTATTSTQTVSIRVDGVFKASGYVFAGSSVNTDFKVKMKFVFNNLQQDVYNSWFEQNNGNFADIELRKIHDFVLDSGTIPATGQNITVAQANELRTDEVSSSNNITWLASATPIPSVAKSEAAMFNNYSAGGALSVIAGSRVFKLNASISGNLSSASFDELICGWGATLDNTGANKGTIKVVTNPADFRTSTPSKWTMPTDGLQFNHVGANQAAFDLIAPIRHQSMILRGNIKADKDIVECNIVAGSYQFAHIGGTISGSTIDKYTLGTANVANAKVRDCVITEGHVSAVGGFNMAGVCGFDSTVFGALYLDSWEYYNASTPASWVNTGNKFVYTTSARWFINNCSVGGYMFDDELLECSVSGGYAKTNAGIGCFTPNAAAVATGTATADLPTDRWRGANITYLASDGTSGYFNGVMNCIADSGYNVVAMRFKLGSGAFNGSGVSMSRVG